MREADAAAAARGMATLEEAAAAVAGGSFLTGTAPAPCWRK